MAILWSVLARQGVVRVARDHQLSGQRADGHGGGRLRPQAAAGSPRASERVWDVGVDAGRRRAGFEQRGWRVQAGRGGVQGGVLTRDHVLGRQVRGVSLAFGGRLCPGKGTGMLSRGRGARWTRWISEGVDEGSSPRWSGKDATACTRAGIMARCRRVRGVQHGSETS